MTAAEEENVKSLLDQLEQITELSIKEVIYVNEHTIKMACGAPLEREGLRAKAAKAIKLRTRAAVRLERIIHDEPGLIQSFCVNAVRGTIISVEEVIEILTSKTVNGYPDGWLDGGWEESVLFLVTLEDSAVPPCGCF